MFEPFRDLPLGWGELFKRTIKEASDDGVTGLAAQLAYYFFLALFPALLFLVSLASFFPLENMMDEVTRALARFAPGDVLAIVQDQLKLISDQGHGGLLTLGFLGTIWSVSAAIAGMMDTLNKAYEIQEGRPWWKVRLIAIGLTLGVGLFILLSFAVVILSPLFIEPLARYFGLGDAFRWTWALAQWPVVFLLIATAVGLIYYFGPDAEQRWEWLTPGSLLATLLWIVASLGFRVYLTSFGNYNETYGAIGGVIIALLWLYLTGLAFLIGAELNAEIEHASPHGKEAGEKRPGEKKKIGRLAADAYARAKGAVSGGRRWLAPPQAAPSPAAEPAMASDAEWSPEGSRRARRAAPGHPLRRVTDRKPGFAGWLLGAGLAVAQVVVAFRRRTRA
jgi:membrane protein